MGVAGLCVLALLISQLQLPQRCIFDASVCVLRWHSIRVFSFFRQSPFQFPTVA